MMFRHKQVEMRMRRVIIGKKQVEVSDMVPRPWDVERNQWNARDEGGTILIWHRDPLVVHHRLQDVGEDE